METQTITAPNGSKIASVEFDAERITYVIEPTEAPKPLPEPFEIPVPTDRFDTLRIAHMIADRYNDNQLDWYKHVALIGKSTYDKSGYFVYSTAHPQMFEPRFKREYMARHAFETFPAIFKALYS